MTDTVKQAETAAPPAGNGNGGGPGDFEAGFVAALKTAVAPKPAEDHVSVAVGLGWYMAALSYPGDVTRTAAAARGDFGALGALSDGEVLDFCHSQVQVGFAKLKQLITGAGLALPPLEDCLDKAKAGSVASKALAVLTAADARLGKAYGVGRGLMNLTTRPAADATLAGHFTRANVAPVIAAIDDLSSALTPHAGHSVRFSVKEWLLSVEDGTDEPKEGDVIWMQLARQGELWRALLSGEKSGLDMLEIEDYLDAAERLTKRIRNMAIRIMRQFWYVGVLVLALVAAGVAILLLTDSAASVIAGAGSLLAAVGITWRGAGQSMGGLSGKLEQPLWGAELDQAITQAITLLPRRDGRDVALHRREVAVALGGG